jgi:UDP-N-acetylmuramoyl-L-alanyl-D-glutamate--2,6-diaminopimelate ligase
MKFLELIGGETHVGVAPAGDPQITGLEHDSRRIRPGNCFVAFRGGAADGNQFIDAAIANGAVAVVTDSHDATPREGIGWMRVANGRRALADLSARFYGYPAEKLRLSGITGTNGKSTTAFLLESILNAAGHKTILIGTIEYHLAGDTLPAPHTTPESLELNRIFAAGAQRGAREVVMEVSSHALAQERVWGIGFDVAVFTNLTRDHLDFHQDFEKYFAAKRILFEGCGATPPSVAVINTDDPWGAKLEPVSRRRGSRVAGYGQFSGDFRASQVNLTPAGTQFELSGSGNSIRIETPLLGRFNVYNILAASAAASARGCTLEQIASGVRALQRVPGRFERVDCGQPFTVVVDYAHTDDALKNLITVARDFVGRTERGGRVITVFGCGGDRDRRKRPLMGHAAGAGSDFVIMTSDNPRSEDPLAIIAEAEEGVKRSGARYTIEPERRAAIGKAIAMAAPGDIVLLAGKGHEKVQVTRTGSAPFDDVEVARKALVRRGFGASASTQANGAR